MLERSAEGVAREAFRPRVPRHVAARHRQADQRDRQGDGPLAQHGEHLPHAHPAQARAHQQRGAGALRSQTPARRLNSAVESLAEFKPEAAAPAEATQAKILLVVDEPTSLFALQELLSTLGQNLMIAQSGEAALRLALKHDIAVILPAVRMPRIDGF